MIEVTHFPFLFGVATSQNAVTTVTAAISRVWLLLFQFATSELMLGSGLVDIRKERLHCIPIEITEKDVYVHSAGAIPGFESRNLIS